MGNAEQFGMNKNCDVCFSTTVSLGGDDWGECISSQYIPLLQDTDEMKCS